MCILMVVCLNGHLTVISIYLNSVRMEGIPCVACCHFYIFTTMCLHPCGGYALVNHYKDLHGPRARPGLRNGYKNTAQNLINAQRCSRRVSHPNQSTLNRGGARDRVCPFDNVTPRRKLMKQEDSPGREPSRRLLRERPEHPFTRLALTARTRLHVRANATPP